MKYSDFGNFSSSPKVWHALLLFPQIYKNLCERLTNEIICHDPRSDDRNRDERYLSTFKKCPDGRDICLPVFDGIVVPVLTQGFASNCFCIKTHRVWALGQTNMVFDLVPGDCRQKFAI